MRTTVPLLMLLVLLLTGLGVAPAAAQATSDYPRCAPDSFPQLQGVTDAGARWFICVPATDLTAVPPRFWNGILVIYAHGYESPVDPADPKAEVAPTFANLTNPVDETYLPDLIEGQGFAFGATTYRRTGLVAADGVEDVAAVAKAARAWYASLPPLPPPLILPPLKIFVTGVSEGGLVTTLALEKYPELFAGGLATCGPIGDFRFQLNYFGDFRTLYDYFFPDILPGNTANIPTALMKYWPTKFEPMALAALAQNADNAGYLMSTSRAAYVPSVPETIGLTTSGILWYNVYAMENAIDVLGGNPYDNTGSQYAGSADDAALNAGVHRYKASPTALDNLTAYQTTGQLNRPLVTLHNTLDPIVPAAHEGLYLQKAIQTGSVSRFIPLTAAAPYGHCNFTAGEVLQAFGILLAQP